MQLLFGRKRRPLQIPEAPADATEQDDMFVPTGRQVLNTNMRVIL